MSDLQMRAYYYSFHSTGNQGIDLVLSAVACAGKAFHHTDSWTDECDFVTEPHEGKSPADWIQNAAIKAAATIAAQSTELLALRERVGKLERAAQAFTDKYAHLSDGFLGEIAKSKPGDLRIVQGILSMKAHVAHSILRTRGALSSPSTTIMPLTPQDQWLDPAREFRPEN